MESSPEALSSQYLDVQVQPTSQQQIPLDQTAPPSYSSLTEATQISDNGLTLEEKIKLLDSRLLKGEIDQNSYDYLRAELEEH